MRPPRNVAMNRPVSTNSLKRITSWPVTAWLVIGLFGAGLGAVLAADGCLPWPQCPLREFTGLPCPSCGCTRSLLALVHADPGKALRFNPLFGLACLALPSWVITSALGNVFGWSWPKRFRERAGEIAARRPVWPFVLALVALNWLYLVLNLPK